MINRFYWNCIWPLAYISYFDAGFNLKKWSLSRLIDVQTHLINYNIYFYYVFLCTYKYLQ